jgi:hypothetical protein
LLRGPTARTGFLYAKLVSVMNSEGCLSPVIIRWLSLASWLSHQTLAGDFQLHPQTLPEVKPCFGRDAQWVPETLGVTWIQVDVSGSIPMHVVGTLTVRRLPANRHRVADGVKILLDIAKESSDWCPPLKSVLGGVNALIKHYEVWAERVAVTHNLHERPQESEDVREKVEDLIPYLNRFKQTVNAVVSDGDQAEKERRSELFRYARWLPTPPTIADGVRSALGEIEKKSQDLLVKGTATRFVDKGADSGEVARLVERLREAITHYQVSENCFVARNIPHAGGQISQQQAIYEKITKLTVRIPTHASVCYADDRLFCQGYVLGRSPRGNAMQ